MAWKRRRGGGSLVGSLTGVRGEVRAAQREEGDDVRYEVDCCDGKHQVKVEDGGGGRRNPVCWDRVRSIIFPQKSIHRGVRRGGEGVFDHNQHQRRCGGSGGGGEAAPMGRIVYGVGRVR